MIYLDIETYSDLDLTKVGAYRYAEHPSTKVILLAWFRDGGSATNVMEGDDGVRQLIDELADYPYPLVAWNAQFERRVLGAIDKRLLDPSRWICASASSMAGGYPAGLMDASGMVGLTKMDAGKRLINRYCVKGEAPEKSPDDWRTFVEYCRRDVDAMRAVVAKTGLDTSYAYYLTEAMNDKGLPVDLAVLPNLRAQCARDKARTKARLKRLTGSEAAQGSGIKKWIAARVPGFSSPFVPGSTDDPTRRTTTGAPAFDKEARRKLLSLTLPAEVREVVELCDKPTNMPAKLDVIERRSEGGRLHGAFQWHGAATGRYSSKGVQVHNLPRSTTADPEATRAGVLAGDDADVKGYLRHVIRAEAGRVLVGGDWSQLQGRIAPWLIMDKDPIAAAKIAAHSDPDRDVYSETALLVMGRAGGGVTSEERQAFGKVPELALTFGGGDGALEAMAASYDVKVDNPPAVVRAWRRVNPWAQALGYRLMAAAKLAWDGYEVSAGPLKMRSRQRDLIVTLPSGRESVYVGVEWTDSNEFFCSARRTKVWPGLFTQNMCMAIESDILSYAAARCGPALVGHVHDELICEAVESDAGRMAQRLKIVMEDGPDWATGLPLKADVWIGESYGVK